MPAVLGVHKLKGEIRMSKNITRLVDALIDAMALIRDHFIISHHVTLSEGFLFSLAAIRSVWFITFGVNIGAMDGPLAHDAWTPIFIAATIAHLASFLFRDLWVRAAVMCAYALVWSTLSLLAAMVKVSSAASPTFMICALIAVIIAVKMLRERKFEHHAV